MRRQARRTLSAPGASHGQQAFCALDQLEPRVLLALNPTAEEQYLLELTNRFRLNPQAELAKLTSSLGTPARSANADVDSALRFFNVSGPMLAQQWTSLTAAQPLAWNLDLYEAAEGHNNAMIAADQQTHQAPGEPDLGQRANNAGYTGWSNLGESVYAFSRGVFHAHAGFLLDWGNGPGGIQDPPGHRESAINPAFREVGIRIVNIGTAPNRDVGPQVVTQDFGRRFAQGSAYLLGAVFVDTSSDGYSIGEGLGGVTITAVAQNGTPGALTYTTTSLSAGGWQVQVPAGTYAVTFSGGGFGAAVTYRNIVVSSENVKLDASKGVPPPAPIIQLWANDLRIPDGDTAPRREDNTDLGNANLVGQFTTVTFSIYNAGNQILRVSGFPRVSITGANAGDFTLVTDAAATVNPLGVTTFTVRFDPSALGLRRATVTILSDDGTTPAYDFAIQGRGVQRPIVSVSGNRTQIAPDDTTPTTADWTSFAGVDALFSSKVRIFTINNTGLKAANISSVSITGAQADLFTLFVLPSATIAAGASSQFRVRFTPGGFVGFASATITIASDDPLHPSYSFSIRGNGLALPRIELSGNGVVISQNDASPSMTDRTNFGSLVATGNANRVRQFTIRNTGLADLQLTGPQWVTIGGVHAGDFTISAQPATALLSPGQSVTFRVRFNPLVAGSRGAAVMIASNDPVFGLFTFAIAGVGT